MFNSLVQRALPFILSTPDLSTLPPSYQAGYDPHARDYHLARLLRIPGLECRWYAWEDRLTEEKYIAISPAQVQMLIKRLFWRSVPVPAQLDQYLQLVDQLYWTPDNAPDTLENTPNTPSSELEIRANLARARMLRDREELAVSSITQVMTTGMENDLARMAKMLDRESSFTFESLRWLTRSNAPVARTHLSTAIGL